MGDPVRLPHWSDGWSCTLTRSYEWSCTLTTLGLRIVPASICPASCLGSPFQSVTRETGKLSPWCVAIGDKDHFTIVRYSQCFTGFCWHLSSQFVKSIHNLIHFMLMIFFYLTKLLLKFTQSIIFYVNIQYHMFEIIPFFTTYMYCENYRLHNWQSES